VTVTESVTEFISVEVLMSLTASAQGEGGQRISGFKCIRHVQHVACSTRSVSTNDFRAAFTRYQYNIRLNVSSLLTNLCGTLTSVSMTQGGLVISDSAL
jgi:hypothetical protein